MKTSKVGFHNLTSFLGYFNDQIDAENQQVQIFCNIGAESNEESEEVSYKR